MVTPARRREAVAKLKEWHGFSERRACRVISASRRRINYRSRKNDDALRVAMRRIAAERRRFGYKRLAIMLRREGHVHNLKKIYRIYREEGLMVNRYF